MGAMILQSVEVLVALAARLALVGLIFLHAERAGVGGAGRRVNDRVGAVDVFLELLRLMTILLYSLAYPKARDEQGDLQPCDT